MAERVKALVSVPVATVGRVVSVEAGEKILSIGKWIRTRATTD